MNHVGLWGNVVFWTLRRGFEFRICYYIGDLVIKPVEVEFNEQGKEYQEMRLEN